MSDPGSPAVGHVVALAVATGVASLIVTVAGLTGSEALLQLPGVTLLSIAAAFALAEAVPVHLEHRREAVSITLSTVPFVIGLFALSPVALIEARLLGSGLALVLHRRQLSVKLLVNLVSFWVHTWVSVLVFRALAGPDTGAAAWPGVFVAVIAGDLAQTVVLTTAISLYQRRWEATLLRSAALSCGAALIETSLGLVALSLVINEPAALLPLGVVSALVLVSYRTHRSLGERHRELGQLYDFTTVIGDALPDGRVVPTVLAQARDLMHAERSWLHLAVDEHDGQHPALQAVRETGGPLLVEADDDRYADVLHSTGARQLLIAPLHGGSSLIGALVVADRSGEVRGFTSEDLRLFSIVANQAAVALENDRLVVRLQEKAAESEHQSLHDALTGLPNRVLFARMLETALAGDAPTAVLLLDLDRFKEVNDTLGHQNGDLLLQQVGTRLRGTLRRGDVIARLGGDEFAVLLRDIEGDQAALQAARGIVELLERPFAIGDMSVDVGASIGIAVAPRDGKDPVTLLQRADVAMYTAKADQTSVETYVAERDGYSPERLTLVSDLRHAIHEGQLEVHYQPQVELIDGHVAGVEALVRWCHPTRGTVYPDDFISVAEHTGLIRPLTLFVLGEALAMSTRWKRSGIDLRVSVNVSARSLVQGTFVDDVTALLRRFDVPAGALCLEVTESSIMAEPRRTIATLEALRAAGITIAIDDFGTGHSSLAYIKQLPVGEIKIDKSFVLSMVHDRSDEAIVDTVLNLARNLGVAVVAEGVEDEETAACLQAMGCSSGQGYLFARPMPAAHVLTWLAERASERNDVIVPLAARRAVSSIASVGSTLLA